MSEHELTQAIGKTIADVEDYGRGVAILFTDNTHIFVEGVNSLMRPAGTEWSWVENPHVTHARELHEAIMSVDVWEPPA